MRKQMQKYKKMLKTLKKSYRSEETCKIIQKEAKTQKKVTE